MLYNFNTKETELVSEDSPQSIVTNVSKPLDKLKDHMTHEIPQSTPLINSILNIIIIIINK